MHTADLLERAGVAHIGTFRTRAERRRPVILTTSDGVRIGVVAGTFGTNGFPLPDRPRVVGVDVGRRRTCWRRRTPPARAGADVVVVHLHGGDEYSHQPNAAQTALVERLTRSPDVDLVLGDHAHVVQPDHAGSTGSGSSTGWATWSPSRTRRRADTYQGILVRFTFTERRSGRFAVTRAAYAPIGWNVWHPGARPIRVVRLRGAAARRRHVVRRGAGRAARAAPALSRQPTMQAVPTRSEADALVDPGHVVAARRT